MKRFLIILLALLVAICTCACAEGETDMLFDNDQKVANKKFEEILTAIQTQDSETLKALFSVETLQTTDSFNTQACELFAYFEGEFVSYDDWGGPYVETSREGFQMFQAMESTYDVKTTEGTYRVAIQSVTKDTCVPNNVGIKSLYIIKYEDDLFPQYAYWGDGEFTPGINIGVPNSE